MSHQTEQRVEGQEEILHRLDMLLPLGPSHDCRTKTEGAFEALRLNLLFRLTLHLLPELLALW